jgi:predicted O-methyltransferase YrrM
MKRISKTELEHYISKQQIPFIEGDRPALFKLGIEEAKKINGMFLEFGVYSGGTANTIADLIPDKTLYGFDSFSGLKEDYTENWKKGSMKHDIPKVRNNVELIVGYVEDTYENFLRNKQQKISFIHIDVDLYSATKCVLDKSLPYIQSGTIIQFDELFEVEGDWWYQDEFTAWTEFLNENNIEASYLGWNGLEHMHCSFRIK